MSFLCNIEMNGKTYEITEDGFGIKYIDGVRIDQFVENAELDELEGFAIKGAHTMATNPEHAIDIIQREELTQLEPFL